MTLQTILGKKLEQSQKFLEDGRRIPVTRIWVKGNVVVSVKTHDKDHYSAVQLGFSEKKKTNKAMMGHIKGANLEKAPYFLKEVRLSEDGEITAGTMLNASEILSEGDIIDITGVSKGKGYAGVVKRHGFHGGPRTHGQSDRERAPGSIGQTTTPGRVFKGKKMAGRMGNENVTIKNLEVVGVTDDEILIKGLIPGSVNSFVIVKKVGENKNFTPLFSSNAGATDNRGKKDEASVGEQSDSGNAQQSGEKQDSEDRDSSQSSSDDAQTVDSNIKAQSPSSLSENRPTEAQEKSTESEKPILDSSKGGQAPISKKVEENKKEEDDLQQNGSGDSSEDGKGEVKGETENAG